MNILKTVFVILGLFGMAYSLTVDFAPIQVGNVWVYEKSFKNAGWYIRRNYNSTKTIQITTTEPRNDTICFSANVRDSGIVNPLLSDSSRIDVKYTVQGFKTRDSVIVKTSTVNDSIIALDKGAGMFYMGDLFPFSVRDTVSPLPYEQFYLWENLIVDRYFYEASSPQFVEKDSCILLQNVGLLESTYLSYNGKDNLGGTTSIKLISFNGKPAPDINVSSVNRFPQNKLVNGNQIAFRQLLWINQGNHIRPQNVRAVFDVRGRAVSASGSTNRHLNDGIYLYRY